MSRNTKRPKRKNHEHDLFLYGVRNHLRNAKAYCELHNCYLSAHNIKYKKCNYKSCKYLKELE